MLTPPDGVPGAVVVCYDRETIAAGARAPVCPLVRRGGQYRTPSLLYKADRSEMALDAWTNCRPS
jgi:hypothetical protein